ncbi:MAG: PilW family protein, partial [Pseudomonadota bacterium]
MKHRPAESSSGLTLVELLVALALSALLSMLAMHLLLQGRLALSTEQARASLHESGRYALRLLQREIEMSGFYAAWPVSPRSDLTGVGTPCFIYLSDTSTAMEILQNLNAQGQSSPAHGAPDDCLLPGHMVVGSDAVIVRRSVDRPLENPGSSRNDSTYIALSAGDARLSSGAGLALAETAWRYAPQVFFLRDFARKPGDGIPTLCRKRLSPNRPAMTPTECLIEGIENLQLSAAVDEDGDERPDSYQDITVVHRGSRAKAVSLDVTVRSLRRVPRAGKGAQYLRLRVSGLSPLRNA